jgi:hypothetical protein
MLMLVNILPSFLSCRSIDPQPRFVEKVTSDTSLAPFEMDELSKMLDIMNVLESMESVDPQPGLYLR